MTKSELVHRIKRIIPDGIVRSYRKSKRFLLWERQQMIYTALVKRIRQKEEPIRALFIVNDASIWKYDSLYRLMEHDSFFSPQILVCPTITNITKQQAQDKLQRTFDVFSSHGYNVVKATEDVSLPGVNIATFQPDILFYSSLWTNYMESQYDVYNLCNYLKCYVNYGFSNTAGEWGYASAFHGLMWRYFVECEDVRAIAVQAQPREMKNIVVTGYPIYDEYKAAKGDTSIWKSSDLKFKRVIWAPHHTIEGHDGVLKFSTFIENAEEMLSLVEKYKDSIQFVFKPHPLLMSVLYHHPQWGKERTDAYYNNWANGVNSALVNGSYIELFKSSDAMIHDCGSFIVEYLYTKKPVMYLGHSREEQSNVVGRKAYCCHYHGDNIEDVQRFLDNVVLDGNDNMKQIREEFYDEVLLPPNDCSVAENMIHEIKKELCK